MNKLELLTELAKTNDAIDEIESQVLALNDKNATIPRELVEKHDELTEKTKKIKELLVTAK